MMFLNGAVNSADPSIQLAYQYMMNQENRGKQIPTEVMEAYEKFMNGLKDGSIGYQNTTQDMRNAQRRRSHEIAMGNADIDDYTYDDLKTRNDLFPEDIFRSPTKIFPHVTREYKFYDKDKRGFHMGIDIGHANYTNLDITPAYKGEVVFSGDAGLNGNMVVVKHTIYIDGTKVEFYTSYSHLNSIENIASVGKTVNPGDLIGIMGKTGDSDGIHLHFAVFTREGEITKSFSAYGYGSYKINDYAWKKASDTNAIYYDPLEVFRTNGAIILYTLNILKKYTKKNN